VLINKKTCLRCIEENIEFFKSVLEKSVIPQLILDKLATKEDLFEEVFDQHDGLLGILFDYGTYNSMTFQKQKEIFKATKAIFSKRKKFTMPTTKLVSFNLYNLPRFAEDYNHADSFKVHLSYESTWKQLSQIYTNKNLLEVTLEKLIEK
jgi:hypothetical protein